MLGKNLTIGQKITYGFMMILTLQAVLAFSNYLGVGHILEDATEVVSGNSLDGTLAQREVDHLNWISKICTLLNDEKLTELNVETDHTKCGFGKWLYGEGRKEAELRVPSLAPLFTNIEKPHKELHDSAIAIKEVFVQSDMTLPARLVAIEAAHLSWASRVRDAIISKSTSLENVETDATKCGLGQWLESDQAKTAYAQSRPKFRELFDSIHDVHQAMHKSAERLKELLAAQQFDEAAEAFRSDTLPQLDTTIETLRQMVSEAESQVAGKQQARKIYTEQTLPAVKTVQELLSQIRQEARSKIMTDVVMIEGAQKVRRTTVILGAITLALGLGLALALTRTISRLLTKIAQQMAKEASQVASAADQILSSSQTLSDGASGQAAAVEEISATMEEVTAMTRQDADNARLSEDLIKEANQVLLSADGSMQKLTASMDEISQASTETHKIVKTIDEIAFQTNLLALNAAVEAARAGEAGAGFAVVANEVRALAMRATEAAKNTSTLIEGTVKKIQVGSTLVTETNDSFHAVSQSIAKMNTTVGEIAGSTKEQAIAISQVNDAITQVDNVTQQNAATAEATSAASQQLNAQVQEMRASVQELLAMVGNDTMTSEGGGSSPSVPHAATPSTRPATKAVSGPPATKLPPSQALPRPTKIENRPPSATKLPNKPVPSRKPNEVIPFDDDKEFEDF